MIALLLLAVLSQAPEAAPSAAELVKRLDAAPGVKEKDKPFEIAVSLSRLYASQGRYPEAMTYLGQAVASAEPARAFFVGARPQELPAEPACPGATEATLGARLAAGQAARKAGKTQEAQGCALLAVNALLDAQVEYGELAFVAGDARAALDAFEKVLATRAEHPGALYGRAAVLLDTRGDDAAALTRAGQDLERFLAVAPSSGRAPQATRLLERARAAAAAGGMSRLPAVVAQAPAPAPAPVSPPQLSPEVVAAFQNVPVTGDMEKNFEKLIADGEEHLARGRFAEARAAYLQVMPYQPANPRLRAGMAWTMIKLNRQPMADNVWRTALQSPDAIAALGDVLKAKGDEAGARELWTRLKEWVPGYSLAGRL